MTCTVQRSDLRPLILSFVCSFPGIPKARLPHGLTPCPENPVTPVPSSPPKLAFRVLLLKPVKWPTWGGREEPLGPGRGVRGMLLGPTATKLTSTEAKDPDTSRNVRKEARA